MVCILPAGHVGMVKAGIHPEYVKAHVRCTCGDEFTTRSTQPEIHVETCSHCHPFYRQSSVERALGATGRAGPLADRASPALHHPPPKRRRRPTS